MAGKLAHLPDVFQQQAIDSMARGIRIVAPAGSGKSETLARRVAKRIEKDGVDPERILVLTFDNAAKKSLKQYFSTLKVPNKLLVLTYDEFALRIHKAYFHDHPEVVDIDWQTSNSRDSETRAVRATFNERLRLFSVLNWDGWDRNPADLRRHIKNEGYAYDISSTERSKLARWLANDYFHLPPLIETTTESGRTSTSTLDTQLKQLHEEATSLIGEVQRYDKEIARMGKRDLEDRKLLAATLLRLNDVASRHLKKQYDEIVIDEAQDISRVDAILAWQAAHEDARVVIAGDDDQTIYGWRNASSRFLKNPNLIFGDIEFETYSLNLNYRSPAEILDPAKLLISNNADRIEKYPGSALDTIGEVQVTASATDAELDRAVVDSIQRELENGRKPEDIAVLCYRKGSTWTTRHFEDLLRKSNIPLVESTSEENIKSPGVWVRTFYRAKGREWPVVILPHMNDDCIPSPVSVKRGEVESERRLMYVAMTRASEQVHIHYLRQESRDSCNRNQGGKIIATNGASRFLFEAELVGEEAASAVLDAAEATADDSPDLTGPLFQTPAETDESAALPPSPAPPAQPPAPSRKPDKTKPASRSGRDKQATSLLFADHEQHVRDTWHRLEGTLRRVGKDLELGETPPVRDIVAHLYVRGRITLSWKKRLDAWRIARNHAEHHMFAMNESHISRSEFLRRSDEMREGATLANAYLNDYAKESATAPRVWRQKVIDLALFVGSVELPQSGDISLPATKYHHINAGDEIDEALALQFYLVLRGVRFQVPDIWRWDRSPTLIDFVQDKLGHCPKPMRANAGNLLKAHTEFEAKLLHEYLSEILEFECTNPEDRNDYLNSCLMEALTIGNGSLSDGLVLSIAGEA